ncbi:MAG TPA: CoA ester lyase [Jatrophihabitans sp.]|jgi:citrate lyase subunit beta/citryl-CoA lyase
MSTSSSLTSGRSGDAVTARSWLFAPADRPELFLKAVRSGADAIICDLEDAVPPGGKATARRNVADWLSSGGRAWVRVNAADTAWHDADLAALRGSAGLRGVVLPKAARPEEVEQVSRALGEIPVIPLLETAVGIHRANDIATCTKVARLGFGSIDFANDISCAGDDDALLLARSTIVLASRVAGLPAPIDGVTTALGDRSRVLAETVRAARLGFGAKLCIHPDQIATVCEGFRPSADELAWAARVVAADRGTGSAQKVDREMVDQPVLLRAQGIIRRAELP